LDSLVTGDLRNLEGVARRIEFIRGDIRDLRILKKAVRGREVVFHQAALRSVPKSVKSPIKYHEVNCTATLQLLKVSLDYGVRRVVYASSSSAYGEQRSFPQRETAYPHPQSPYAASKLAGEAYCTMFTRLYGLKTVSLRYFNVFGPRQSLESEYAIVVPKFVTCLLRNQSPPIHGDGFQTRDFTYVDNVVQANLKAAVAPKAGGEVFNVATGRRHSVRELFETLAHQTGVDLKPRFVAERPGDVRHTWADITKAKRLLGYRVEVSFNEGLRRTVAWFQQHRP
jgi:UDP-glucose 4-epimerase